MVPFLPLEQQHIKKVCSVVCNVVCGQSTDGSVWHTRLIDRFIDESVALLLL